MTFFYPDISSYESGISLSGMLAVVVKATEGTTYTNPDYARVAADATSRGIPWAAYHFLHHNSDPAAQARHFHAVAGNAPCMLDVETAGDGTQATVADCLSFTNTLKGLGGFVRLAYFPHWYWQALGSPSLVPLAQAGMALVSSDYTTYSDTGPGWASYGGVTPTVWQYTDAHQLNGFTVDYNAYRGTADQFRTLLTGKDTATMNWSDTLPTPPYWGGRGNSPGQILVDLGSLRDWLYDTPGGHASTNPPPPGTRLDLITQAAQKVLAGQVGGAPLSDAQMQALTAAVVAAMPSAADVAAHLDYAALGKAIVAHFSITP